MIAGAAAVFFVGLGRPTYETRDVTRYAQMVLEMRHADTLVPTLHGRPYHEAAPLSAWAPCFVSWVTGGLTPLSGRLLPAIAAFATALLALHLGSLRSLRAGWIAGAACVLNVLAVTYGRGSRVDALLGFAVAGAVVGCFGGVTSRSASRRRLLFAVAGASTALGIAAKGPYAAALVAAALGPFLVVERRRPGLLEGCAIAAFTAAALTAAWLVPYLRYLGADGASAFYQQLFMSETLSKFEGGYGKLAPFWAYAVDVLPQLAPWSLLAVVALVRLARAPRAASTLERLCASWLLSPLLLLSISRGKHVRYLIPLIPPLAVLAACELDHWLTAFERRPLRGVCALAGGLGALLCLAGLAGPIALGLRSGGSDLYAVGAGLACAAGGAFAAASARRGRLPASLLGLYAGAAAAVTFVYASVLSLPAIAERQSYVRLGEALSADLLEDDGALTLAEPSDPARRIDASQLALHLGNRWIDVGSADDLPASGLVLAATPIAGRRVRAEIEWVRGRHASPERWYLLEAPRGATGSRVTTPPAAGARRPT